MTLELSTAQINAILIALQAQVIAAQEVMQAIQAQIPRQTTETKETKDESS